MQVAARAGVAPNSRKAVARRCQHQNGGGSTPVSVFRCCNAREPMVRSERSGSALTSSRGVFGVWLGWGAAAARRVGWEAAAARAGARGSVPPWEGGRAGGERTRAVAGSVCAVAATGAQAANGNVGAARRLAPWGSPLDAAGR